MHRDIKGARDCWERAREVADAMPADEAGVTEKRIEPRARLALTEWLVGSSRGGEQFVDELRLLTAATGDVLPLALAMSGRVTPNPMKILNSRLPRPPRSRHIETRRASGESPSSIYTTSRDATLRRERRTHRMASGDKATVGGRPSAPGR